MYLISISELSGKSGLLTVGNSIGSSNYTFTLEMLFEPKEYTQKMLKSMDQTNLMEVSVKFKAHPSPSSCHWQIGNINIPFGKSRLNGSILSSPIYHDESIPDEYLINLMINPVKSSWVGKNHSLMCTNQVNTTIYLFKLPKQEEILTIVEDKGFKLMSSTSLIIIVVLILVFLCGLFLFLFHHMQR